jgi:hypothetical protein
VVPIAPPLDTPLTRSMSDKTLTSSTRGLYYSVEIHDNEGKHTTLTSLPSNVPKYMSKHTTTQHSGTK